jgi:tetratricopeptide (TPR) repeat protein
MQNTVKILFFSLLLSRVGIAQDGVSLAKANTKATGMVPAIENQNNKYLIPLFGKAQKTPVEKAADEAFVGMCIKNFSDKKEASVFFTDRGWDYISESEPDTAIHRFNMAYLLNPANAEAYWGLGVICFQRGQYDLASEILEMGMQADSSIADMVVDLATVELSCFEKNQHQHDLAKAHRHLANAIEIDPTNFTAWHKRAEAEYYLGNFENAWECLHSARLLEPTKLNLQFAERLHLKLPDPREIFRF